MNFKSRANLTLIISESQRSDKQQQSSNLALIYVKMAPVMGVTWIFGIGADLQAFSFLWYPYVVLNSLQGECPSAFGAREKLERFLHWNHQKQVFRCRS